MSIAEAPDAQGYLAGRAVPGQARPVGRRDQIEAVGLLLGILGVLLAVVLTMGATPGLS